MSDVPMVNVYETDAKGAEKIVYRPANQDELADLEQRQQAFAGSELDSIKGGVQALLADCDWTQLPDAPLSPSERAMWVSYRQQLRDYADGPGFDPLNPPPLPTAPG